MRWWAKAALAQALSHLPGGRRMHQLVQRRVTKTLPLPEWEFEGRLEAANEHLAHVRLQSSADPSTLTFFEFGAGWDLTVALALAAGGVRRQYCLDLHPLAHADLVRVTVARLQQRARAGLVPQPLAERFDPFRFGDGPRTDAELQTWLDLHGITYRAPGDARATGLPDGWVDVVTSTATLEHVPPDDCARIFLELRRVLKPGGVLSCRIDLSDHFSHTDPTVSPWHFLSLSDAEWRLVNAPLVYQNRLRASSFRALAEAAGFEVREARTSFPTACDPQTARCEVHADFKGFTDRADLLATGLRLVCLRPAEAVAAEATATTGRATG